MLCRLSFTHETFVEGLLCARLCYIFYYNFWLVKDAATLPLVSAELVSAYREAPQQEAIYIASNCYSPPVVILSLICSSQKAWQTSLDFFKKYLFFLQSLGSEFLLSEFLSSTEKMKKEDKEVKRKGNPQVSDEGKWCFVLGQSVSHSFS